jgi:hypothetical protein
MSRGNLPGDGEEIGNVTKVRTFLRRKEWAIPNWRNSSCWMTRIICQ